MLLTSLFDMQLNRGFREILGGALAAWQARQDGPVVHRRHLVQCETFETPPTLDSVVPERDGHHEAANRYKGFLVYLRIE